MGEEWGLSLRAPTVPTHQPSPTPQAGFGGLLQCASPRRAGRHQGPATRYQGGAHSQGSSSSLPWDGEGCIPGKFVASAARSGGAAVGVQLPGIPWGGSSCGYAPELARPAPSSLLLLPAQNPPQQTERCSARSRVPAYPFPAGVRLQSRTSQGRGFK